MNDKGKILKALKAVFPYTIPIMAGFGFLGIAYGISMGARGFSFVYPMLMAFFIFGGSLEFLAASMLLSPFAPVEAFIMALAVQARHLFYGIALLEKYKGTGWKKFFLIFGLCDESFAINSSVEAPEGVDKNWFMLWVTWLNRSYWVVSAAIGGLLGNLIKFDTYGIDFVMTAMFVVFLLEQILKEKKHWTVIIGLVASIACRLIFGADSFIIPAMIAILAALAIFKKPIEEKGGLE